MTKEAKIIKSKLLITTLDMTLDIDSEVSDIREFRLNTLVMH